MLQRVKTKQTLSYSRPACVSRRVFRIEAKAEKASAIVGYYRTIANYSETSTT